LVRVGRFYFNHLLIINYPYGLAWAMTIIGIIGSIVGGAIAGAVYKK